MHLVLNRARITIYTAKMTIRKKPHRNIRLRILVNKMFDGVQAAFADRVNIPATLVSRYFAGKGIGEDMKDKICEACGLPGDWLDVKEVSESDQSTKDIAKFVVTAREKLEMTEEKLEEVLKSKKGSVFAWERAILQPSYKQLCALSDMSGFPLPHDDKNTHILEVLGIDLNNIDSQRIKIIKRLMLVHETRLPHLKNIIDTFIDKAKERKEE